MYDFFLWLVIEVNSITRWFLRSGDSLFLSNESRMGEIDRQLGKGRYLFLLFEYQPSSRKVKINVDMDKWAREREMRS